MMEYRVHCHRLIGPQSPTDSGGLHRGDFLIQIELHLNDPISIHKIQGLMF